MIGYSAFQCGICRFLSHRHTENRTKYCLRKVQSHREGILRFVDSSVDFVFFFFCFCCFCCCLLSFIQNNCRIDVWAGTTHHIDLKHESHSHSESSSCHCSHSNMFLFIQANNIRRAACICRVNQRELEPNRFSLFHFFFFCCCQVNVHAPRIWN